MGKASSLTGECVHYWIIETPEGPTSEGRCKHCGTSKEFNNTWADSFNEHQVVNGNNQLQQKSEPEKVAV